MRHLGLTCANHQNCGSAASVPSVVCSDFKRFVESIRNELR